MPKISNTDEYIAFFKRVLDPVKYAKKPLGFHILFRTIVTVSVFVSASTIAKITNLALAKSSLETLIMASVPLIITLVISVSLLIIHSRYSTAAIIRHTMMFGIYWETVRKLFLIDDTASLHAGIGKRLTIVQAGVTNWGTFIIAFITDLLLNVFFLIMGIVYIGFTSTGALPFVFWYMVVVGFLVIKKQKTTQPFFKKRQELMEESNRIMARMTMEKQTILLNGGQEQEKNLFMSISKTILQTTHDIEWKIVWVFWWTRYILEIFRIVVIVFIGYNIAHGTASAGDIVAFGLVFTIMNQFFQTILDQYQTLTENYTYVERLWNFFDRFQDMERLNNGEVFQSGKGDIVFQDVSYAYPESNGDAVKNFSARFEWGKKIALVGRSGAGKSTIVKILLGLLEPTGGTVHIDGQNLFGLRLDSYFPHVGYLSQEPSVFDGTIRENMILGISDTPSDQDLLVALAHAKCDFIDRLPYGLDTLIGEKWVRLSGWERQRLAIARIFLRNPEILVLDEPTSALDSFSEVHITEALRELFQNKTVIIVAHRLQTVKEADNILVLGPGGQVLEQGTHDQLLAQGWEYAQMVDLQSGVVREE